MIGFGRAERHSPLITVWLQVRVLAGPPRKSITYKNPQDRGSRFGSRPSYQNRRFVETSDQRFDLRFQLIFLEASKQPLMRGQDSKNPMII